VARDSVKADFRAVIFSTIRASEKLLGYFDSEKLLGYFDAARFVPRDKSLHKLYKSF
jgi:hypothetical protein